MTINDRVHELRKDRLNLSMEAFGSKVGVKKSAISEIEKGRNNVTEQMLRAICREFNVREEWLREGEGEPFLAMDQDDRIMDAVGRILAEEPESFRRRVISVLAQLPPEHWDVIRQICDKIKKD